MSTAECDLDCNPCCTHPDPSVTGTSACCVCDANQPCDERKDRGHRGADFCPECPEGEVVSVGPMEWETGHQPYSCDQNCGFNG